MEPVELNGRDSVRMSTSKPHFTESIFIMQKKKIQEIISSRQPRDSLKSSLKLHELNKVFVFNDINCNDNKTWDYSTFEVEYLYNEDTPIISIIFLKYLENEWSPTDIKPSTKGIEIRGLIFRSKDFILYDQLETEISATFSLKGESSFWIILRTNGEFDEFSSIIRISKEDKSQNCHISLGTFVRDVHGNLIFRVFSKQQLIDYSKNDTCDLRAHIYEGGDEKVTTKIFVNDSKLENVVTSEFFLPFYEKKSKLMISANGQQCSMKSFIFQTNPKLRNNQSGENRASIYSNERRNCDCCNIY